MNKRKVKDKASGMIRFLVFGDVAGRPGREALNIALPKMREEFQPDSVIINIENIAHGSGFSPETWREAEKWGADAYTLGDHAWDNDASLPLLENKKLPIVRPANYPGQVPGRGYYVFTLGALEIAVINLQGQVFFKNHPNNPFHTLDQLLLVPEIKRANIVLVDFHADATSEARAMGWYADGRVSAVWGTHTHVPTADEQILPEGTGYITDVGMVGNYNSVLGVDKDGSLKTFLNQMKVRFTFDDPGSYEIGALVLDIDPQTSRTNHIAQIRKILNDTVR